jgi:Ca-activated chloride channel family protein
MNLHIKTEAHRLLLIFFLSPMLFAEVTTPSLGELIPKDILPFQVIEEAKEAYNRGDYVKSAELFGSLESDDPSVAYDIANAYYKAKKYSDALHHYAKAKGVDEATRLFNMGNCYFQKGDFSRAIKLYTNSLKLRADDDVKHNLKLARAKRAKREREKQKAKEKQKKRDKKEDEKKRKEEEEKKKRKEEEKKRKEEEQKRKEQEKKDEQKKKSQKKNSNSQKDADASNKQEREDKMSPEEKMRKKELKHLLNQLSKKKMPTMMYQGKENKEKRHDKNPW